MASDLAAWLEDKAWSMYAVLRTHSANIAVPGTIGAPLS
jgi:hypothetical protein